MYRGGAYSDSERVIVSTSGSAIGLVMRGGNENLVKGKKCRCQNRDDVKKWRRNSPRANWKKGIIKQNMV